MRRGVESGTFFQVTTWKAEHEFEPGTVFQLREADIDQEIYGLPEWLSAMHAALLNESATLFRRKYYANGSHAGFILYLSDPQVQDDDVNALREALRNSRGLVNSATCFCTRPTARRTAYS